MHSSRRLIVTRRRLLAGLAITAGLVAAPAAAQFIQDDTEAKLTGEQRRRLARASRQIEKALTRADAVFSIVRVSDHLRLRLPGAEIFVNDTDQVSAAGISILQELAAVMINNPGISAEITSNRSDLDDGYFAKIMSQRCATAAVGVLMSRGVRLERLRATGLGNAYPVTSGAPDNIQSGGRLDILIRADQAQPA